MNRKIFSQVCEWGVSLLVGLAVTNIICFVYERPPGWRDTPNGASVAVREPYSMLVHGNEGYSITQVDQNGYLNPDKKLAEGYILMLGTSHTQGKEVQADKKYSVLVNDEMYDDNMLHTYNIACDGNFLPSQIEHFKAAVQAYPNAEAITIEIFDTDYEASVIESSLVQVEYDPHDSAEYFKNMSTMDKVKNTVKSYVPMLWKIKTNVETVKKAKKVITEKQIDPNSYSQAINKAMALIRSESDAPIVFIYHPKIELTNDGMNLLYSQTWEIFQYACINNGIDVIDSGVDFLKYYETQKKVPYGFINTSFGNGHLNEDGHRIIANEIIRYLEEIK